MVVTTSRKTSAVLSGQQFPGN